MTAEHACTRKQFNKKLSEFGLIQVSKKKMGTLCFCALFCLSAGTQTVLISFRVC